MCLRLLSMAVSVIGNPECVMTRAFQLCYDTNKGDEDTPLEGAPRAHLTYVFGDTDDEIETMLHRANLEQPKSPEAIVIGSTLTPGFIRRVQARARPMVGGPSRIYYNPLFIEPDLGVAVAVRDIENPPMILIGGYEGEDSKRVIDSIINLHKSVLIPSARGGELPKIVVLDVEEAELAKLVHSSYKALNISFANMVGDLAQARGLKGEEIIRVVEPKEPSIGYSYGGRTLDRDMNTLCKGQPREWPALPILQGTQEYNKFHTKCMAARMLKAQEESSSPCFIFQDVCHDSQGDPVGGLALENLCILKIAEYIAREKNTVVVIKDTPAVLQEVKRKYGDLFEYALP